MLIATNVAARGLDIPDVDYIIQYDPPDSVESYVHRAGRACRGDSTKKGVGILFLNENEVKFAQILRDQVKLDIKEYEFPTKKILNVQEEMEKVVATNYNLAKAAQEAFRDCCLAYANHQLKNIFDIGRLDIQALSKSFGLKSIPKVDAIIQRQREAMKQTARKRQHK